LKKELSHRSHELKALGWNQEDLTRYEDLWDYSQRWGLINLEREDRQFLKKAEKLLPKIQNKKISVKKTIEEKSYYLWLYFYLDEINIFSKSNLCNETNVVFGMFNLFLSTFSSSKFLIVVINLGSKLLKGSSASNIFDP